MTEAQTAVAETATETVTVTETPTVDLATEAKKPRSPFRWYVVQTQTNYEKRVQHHINEQTVLNKLEKLVEDVVIPVEQVVEVKNGKKKTSERKFFPGYVLLHANLTDELWHVIKSINHVSGFLGAERGKKPLPISDAEAERMLKQMEDGVEDAKAVLNIDIGEEVRVIDGPFASFQGSVEAIDHEKSKLRVSVSIFGRATPLELDFTQVEKL